jgi:hypothetical protein
MAGMKSRGWAAEEKKKERARATESLTEEGRNFKCDGVPK